MTKVAIIPARGGSKRIPRKNIREFAGKPMIAWSIEAALQCGLFDRVLVSTDDQEIAEVSRSFGAEVPFLRPANLADDQTGTNAVVKHALEWLTSQGTQVEYACCLYATAPFVTVDALKRGYMDLVSSGKSFAFTVTEFTFPIQRAIRISRDGYVEAAYPENIFKRSQDLEPMYHDAGQFYWGRARAFLEDVVTYSPESVPVLIPHYRVQDIDTLEDWRRAELMFAALQRDSGRTDER